MIVLHEAGMIYVYNSTDHLAEAMKRPYGGSLRPMQMASFAFKLSDDQTQCMVLKDRSGCINQNWTYDTKKVLKIVQILMED